MPTHKARMQDVARLAGVASMTVSRVLNGTAAVTDETRDRVHAAIQQLNYQPNPVARSLRQARSNSIGIIVPNFYDQFFATCAHSISLVAKKHQYMVSVTTSDEDAGIEFSEASRMVLNNVEALAIIPASIGVTCLDRPEFQNTHIVTLDRPVQGRHFNSVLVENRQGSRLAVEHLLSHGHRNITCLGLSEGLYTISERHAGYREAMHRHGLPTTQFFNCSTAAETSASIDRSLSGPQPATAFFVSNNFAMQHVLHDLSERRLQIPGDIAVIGFDDFEMADIFHPPITVVRQPVLEIGRIAAELLFSRLQARDAPPTPGTEVNLPVELILRQSCGCAPAPS